MEEERKGSGKQGRLAKGGEEGRGCREGRWGVGYGMLGPVNEWIMLFGAGGGETGA